MLNKLEMLIALAREEHFSRAASSLGITQPSLSSGIRQLEGQLGVQLVRRGSRYGGLTREGENALRWARRIVGDTRQLRDEMRSSRGGLAGDLRLAVIPTALSFAARLVARYGARHPNVRLTLLSRPSSDILRMLESHETDAGLTYIDGLTPGRLGTTPLYEESYRLVCRRGSAFAGRRELGWEELDGQRMCLLTPDMQNRRIVDGYFARAGVTPAAQIASNSTLAMVALVESGDWLTVLPGDIAEFLTKGRALTAVPLKTPRPGHDVGLVTLHRGPHTPVLEALLSCTRQMAAAAG